jgi:hypothetical protein
VGKYKDLGPGGGLYKSRRISDKIAMGKGVCLSLAIYFLGTSLAQANWTVKTIKGAVQLHKKSLRVGQTLPAVSHLQAQAGSLTLKHGSDSWILDFDNKTDLKISQSEDLTLTGQLISGGIKLRAPATNTIPFVLDFGDWQLRKTHGSVRVRGGKVTSEVSVLNESGSLWMKNENLGPAQEVPELIKFKIQNGEDIYSFENITAKVVSSSWSLGSASVKPKKNRTPAAQAGVSGKTSISSLCHSPSANFEQCAWKCFGSAAGGACDTGRPQTHCVRFMCTADGQWKLPTLVPGGECSTKDARVDQCQ